MDFGAWLRNTVAHRLKVLRAEERMTQEELAVASGVSLSAIQSYESAKQCPLLETTYKLAKALHCTPNDICAFPKEV